MSRLFSFVVALALPALAGAQPASDTTCDCSRELAWAASHLERNYAGFVDKVTPATRPAYDSLLRVLRTDAASARSTADCNAVLLRWVGWFRDRHVSIARPGTASAQQASASIDTAAIRARFAGWERVELGDEAAVRARFAAASAPLDPIEGIYESSDGAYRVAVVRAPKADGAAREFAMVVLRADGVWWTPGQVKAAIARDSAGVYATRFYMRDHSERQWEARPSGPVLALSGGAPWLRRWPAGGAHGDTIDLARFRASLNTRFDAREVAKGVVLVGIPTFSDPVGMDSLWARHGALIRGAERLIIDVRGNGGGSDYNFQRFLPLLYTDPIRMPGNHILSTDANLAANEAYLADTTLPAGQRDGIRRGVEEARRRRGRDGWWQGSDGTFRTDRLALPREIAIIQDNGCASSCEGFLMRARQSRKVTTYGTSTAGIFDYGNVRDAKAPCGTLVLKHPTTKSGFLPKMAIDNVGIPPQVSIPPGEVMPVDWVLRRMTGAPAR